jgi:hypothetical protein
MLIGYENYCLAKPFPRVSRWLKVVVRNKHTCPDSKVNAVHNASGDYPSGKKGDVLTVEFSVLCMPCLGLNAGPVRHSEAFRDNAWLRKLTKVGAASGFFLTRPKAAPASRAKRDEAC